MLRSQSKEVPVIGYINTVIIVHSIAKVHGAILLWKRIAHMFIGQGIKELIRPIVCLTVRVSA